MELRDKNGLTEREYLAQYRADKYPRPSVTVEIAHGGLTFLRVTDDGIPFPSSGWPQGPVP